MRGASTRTSKPYRFNFPLLLGGVLVGLLVFLALFGPSLAPHDPLGKVFMMEDRNGELKMAPFEPGQVPGFPLGSDWDGRDILSRLMWAVKPTLVLATLVATTRLVTGTVLGFLGGWYGGILGDAIASLTRVALGIPIIILAIVVIYILGFRFEAWIFVIALTLTGWANTTQIMSERARLIRGEPFIEAARAVGARDRRLLWRHVLPQVRTLVLITWAFEMSAVLLQLAELGFLGFFMGGGAIRLLPDPSSGGFISELIAGTPELGQMLSSGWENFLNVPWMSVEAGSAFFLAVFSFMMLSEGLKRHFAEARASGRVMERLEWVADTVGRKTLSGVAVGLAAGLLMGWFVLGWSIAPVEWQDAAPVDLHPDFQRAFVSALADSYSIHGDDELVKRLAGRWEKEDLRRVMGELKAEATDEAQVQRLEALAKASGFSIVTAVVRNAPLPESEQEAQPSMVRQWLPVGAAAVALLASVGLTIRVLRSRRVGRGVVESFSRIGDVGVREAILPKTRGTTMPDRELLGRFFANYSLDEGSCEEAFAIENEDGFLGMCGVAVSENVGAEPSDRAIAFEVWLFDKTDVHTETKVLMSAHAFHEQVSQGELVTQGAPVLAETGKTFTLETGSLQVTARITEMEYGDDGTSEARFFSRVGIELDALLKRGVGEAVPAAPDQPMS